ncbi:PREDICTED: coiled-coil domain-containing protein 83-like isoform X2 [Priapulus caudatus]|uniref:Coiled-coil domain-containing protein 83-like isoform X2 n=1 Tax=Priapulus caudatus TaxID=37621 RepID=A0ABM1EFJ2_PRICU|nr:PREDICTED: coiled-coil domain-containing protein 83-like isoform X2 [Priapulus caudatus]
MGKKSAKQGKMGKSADQSSVKEVILAYQINIKERALEDLMSEAEMLEKEKKNLYTQIKSLLKQARDMDKELEQAAIRGQEEIATTLREKWEMERETKNALQELQQKFEDMDRRIVAEQQEIDRWTEYRDHGKQQRETQIRLLEQELAEIQRSFETNQRHLEHVLEGAKEDIGQNMTQTLDMEKELASEDAISMLDKLCRQEIMDNKWLKREVVIHERELAELQQAVQTLEQGNLEIMSCLLNCKVEDLNVTRGFFITQYTKGDESEVSLLNKCPLGDTKEQVREPSGVHKAVIDKLKSVESNIADDAHAGSVTDDDNSDDDGEAFERYLQEATEQLQLLTVTGVKMPIHRMEPGESIADTGDESSDQSHSDWPVTHTMLKGLVTK